MNATINPKAEIKALLSEELKMRATLNPAYSLRAFARTLGWSPARLSGVLNGKSGISEKSAAEIGRKLKWHKEKSEFFILCSKAAYSRSNLEKKLHTKNLIKIESEKKFKEVSQENFEVIADWHHFAICELITLSPSDTHARWDSLSIAKRLGIDATESEEALNRLLKVGLLTKTEKGFENTGSVLYSPRMVSDAIRRHQAQYLDKAKTALLEQDREIREFGTLTFSINDKKISDLKKDLQEFQEFLNKKYSTEELHKNAVYHYQFQLFSLEKENLTISNNVEINNKGAHHEKWS